MPFTAGETDLCFEIGPDGRNPGLGTGIAQKLRKLLLAI